MLTSRAANRGCPITVPVAYRTGEFGGARHIAKGSHRKPPKEAAINLLVDATILSHAFRATGATDLRRYRAGASGNAAAEIAQGATDEWVTEPIPTTPAALSETLAAFVFQRSLPAVQGGARRM